MLAGFRPSLYLTVSLGLHLPPCKSIPKTKCMYCEPQDLASSDNMGPRLSLAWS